MHFSGVAKMAVVKRIGENVFYFVFMKWLVSTARFGRFGLYPVLVKKTADVFETR